MAARPISLAPADNSAGAFFGLMAHGAGQKHRRHGTGTQQHPCRTGGKHIEQYPVHGLPHRLGQAGQRHCTAGHPAQLCLRQHRLQPGKEPHIEPHGGGHHPKPAQGHPAAGKRWYPEHDAHGGAQPGNAQQKSQGLPVGQWVSAAACQRSACKAAHAQHGLNGPQHGIALPQNKEKNTMKKILFATTNEGKMREIRMIMEGSGYEITSLKDAGIKVDIDENGSTFEENALIKANALRPYTDDIILADDSGLEVDYLNKEPGVHSARYMGEDTSYDIKNQSIIDRLDGVEGNDRSARFVCVIAASFPDGHTAVTRGTIEGVIAKTPAGCGGFGYDPIVYVPELGKTTAEISAEEKNKISHRGKALRAMKAILQKEESNNE